MKNYILMLGIAGVALGSYAAYAANSATMTVTATIAHDVSLNVTQDVDLGTITINPAYTGSSTIWTYDESGAISFENQGAIVSADNATVGTFTANIPNPSSRDGLDIQATSGEVIAGFFGGAGTNNHCEMTIRYTGSENNFKVFPSACDINDMSGVTTGEHTQTITIFYTAS
ncbi:MAG: hypothetical protein IJ689_00255 [Alphaproteobacteria bacterium]|nr:hypothetical protein [Alphaproteobacteria bacterium]